MGILTPEARSDDKILTRGETVKLLLDSAGYGPIARFQGIYRCSYADEASIPAAYYGYAAPGPGAGRDPGGRRRLRRPDGPPRGRSRGDDL